MDWKSVTALGGTSRGSVRAAVAVSASGRPRKRPVPRLALRPEEAAEAIGVGRSFFFAEILPELRVVRKGRVRLIQVGELERWLDRNAARLLDGAR